PRFVSGREPPRVFGSASWTTGDRDDGEAVPTNSAAVATSSTASAPSHTKPAQGGPLGTTKMPQRIDIAATPLTILTRRLATKSFMEGLPRRHGTRSLHRRSYARTAPFGEGRLGQKSVSLPCIRSAGCRGSSSW